MAIYTWAEAKAQVAKVLGNSTDATLLSEAGDAIQRAFDKLEKHDFEWLFKETVPSPSTPTDIAIVANTTDYNLPADFRKVYSCRTITNDKRPLQYVSQRKWDKHTWDQASYQFLFGYNIIPRSSNTQAQIRFMGTPSRADTARVRYYRTLIRPSVDGTALDVVERYQDWIIYYARFMVLVEHREMDAGLFWKGMADEIWREMTNEDQIQPDQDDYMLPGAAASPTFPPTHPYFTLLQDGL
jgi:hypothetical protein